MADDEGQLASRLAFEEAFEDIADYSPGQAASSSNSLVPVLYLSKTWDTVFENCLNVSLFTTLQCYQMVFSKLAIKTPLNQN